MTRRWWPLAALPLALLASCEVTPRLYLTVRTEAGSTVDQVRVEVFSPTGSDAGLSGAPITRGIDPSRPFEMRVLGRAGGERVRVTVDGLGGGDRQIHQEWVASMPSEGAGYLQIVLWNNCLRREPCDPGMTCAADGSCMPNEVRTLPATPMDAALGACPDGGAGACRGVDGGLRDASSDRGPDVVDAGPNIDRVIVDAADAGIDASADVPRDVLADVSRDVLADVPRDVGVDAGRCPGRSATPRADWTSCATGGACPTLCGAAGACVHAERLVLGRDHGCALRSDGRVSCWGERALGQLGDGETDGGTTVTPVTVIHGLTGSELASVALGGGSDGTCSVDPRGVLSCWGSFNADPLLLPFAATATATTAARLNRSDAGAAANTFEGVASHAVRTCGIVSGGGVRCSSWVRTLADGSSEVIERPEDYPVTDLLRTDGAALTGVREVGVGIYHACAWRRADGSVWCWGSNRYGQLGAPLPGTAGGVGVSNIARAVPGITGATSFGVGDFFACALVGGAVRCWGNADLGRVGTFTGVVECPDSNNCTPVPVVVDGLAELSGPPPGYGSPVAQISVGAEQACARLENGHVWCWGLNEVGQLGLPTTGAGTVESRAGVSGLPVFRDADDIVTGGGGGAQARSWTCAHRRTDCTWWCWGRVPGEPVAPAEPWRPRLLRWGS
jgi:hypothetical protein